MTFDTLLPEGLTYEQLLAYTAGLSVMFGIVALWFATIERQPSAGRLKALKQRRDDLYTAVTAPKRRGLSQQGLSVARRVTKRFKLLTGDQAAKASQKLMQADFRSRDAVTIYMFAKLVLPATFGVLMAFVLYGLDPWGLDSESNLMIACGSVLFGFFAPEIFVKNLADRRRQVLSRALPDALDLMVITSEAGLNLDSSLARVAREIRLSCPELADELELTSIELGFLPERRQALENLEIRTGLPIVRALVSTLAQAEKYGTPLAQSLRVLANEMRDERLMKAEEKAARLPATLTVPMVIFILPSLFIVLIGPGILRVIDNLSTLNL